MKDQQSIVQDLRGIVGEEAVVTDPQVLAMHSVDYVGYRNWERYNKTFLAPISICVVKAANVEEIAAVLQYANENQVVVIPKTGNSSATAAVEAAHGRTIILDGSAMNQILSVDEENRMVTVQCGVPLEHLENYLNERGFTTGHFPQSLPMAQIGGLIATRSIGQFSTLYGGIEDLVVGLEAALPNGEVVRIKNVPRRSAGPDIRQIFIGSEGALAYITEATLRLFEYRPENRHQQAYSVPDMQTGLKALREVMTKGYKPAVTRLHDGYQAEHDYGEFIQDGSCIFLCICEGPADIAKVTGEAILRIFQKHGCTPLGDAPIQKWLKIRNNLCFELDDSPLLRGGVMADTCEIAAVWSEIGKIYDAVLARIPNEVENLVYICGHSSHCYMQGTNIYFKFGVKAEDDFAVSKAAYMQILSVIVEESLKVGGTIAHHHGIGKYRSQWTKEEHGSAYLIMEGLKHTLDPNKIMNEGTLYPAQ